MVMKKIGVIGLIVSVILSASAAGHKPINPISRFSSASRQAAALAHAEELIVRLENSGRSAQAERLQEDLVEAKQSGIGDLVAVPENLLPSVPVWEDNPYVEGALAVVDKMLSEEPLVFPLDVSGVDLFAGGGAYDSRKIAASINLLAWAGLHPQSPRYGDPAVLTEALRRTDAYVDAYLLTNPVRKDGSIHDFFALYFLLDSIPILKNGCPGMIFPSRQVEWDAMARKAGEIWYKLNMSHGGWLTKDNPYGFGSFLNHHVTEGMIVMFAGMLLDNPDYVEMGRRVVELQPRHLYPDGAFSYIRYQNECFGYHTVDIEKFVRYWELTGSPVALEMLQKSRNFYPLSAEPGNVNEWWTVPVWKYQWNSSGYGHAQEIIAGLTGCPYNKAYAVQELAYSRGTNPNFIAAPYFRPDIEPTELPDSYVVYDRNIQGPRGRYGRFSYAASGRYFGDNDSGKMTFAGCMVADPIDGRRYPLNAALMAVYPSIRLKQGDNWKSCAYLTTKEKTAVSNGGMFGALTSKHGLTGADYGPSIWPSAWAGTQQWLFLPDRIVGMVEVFPESGTEESAFDITGRIKLGYGRSGPLRKKEIEALGEQAYAYGDLRVRVWEHNFAGIDTQPAGVLRDTPLKATEIILRDAQSAKAGTQTLHAYANDTQYYFVVEICPEWCASEADVKVLRDDKCWRVLEVRIDHRRWRLVQNVGSTTSTYSFDAPSLTADMKSSIFRSNGNQPCALPETASPASVFSVDINSGEHVVWVVSPEESDHEAGTMSFEDLLANREEGIL